MVKGIGDDEILTTVLDYSVPSCDVQDSLDRVMTDGIMGMMAIMGESFGLCGEHPEICRADVDFDLISRGVGGDLLPRYLRK